MTVVHHANPLLIKTGVQKGPDISKEAWRSSSMKETHSLVCLKINIPPIARVVHLAENAECTFKSASYSERL
jgi:hypothetical protein